MPRGVCRRLSRRVQVWWIPEGLKWGWLNSVSIILRPGAATVNSCAKNVITSRAAGNALPFAVYMSVDAQTQTPQRRYTYLSGSLREEGETKALIYARLNEE